MSIATRTGSPFSYQRFAHAEHLCVACQAFGATEYIAQYPMRAPLEPLNPIPYPPCDVCEQPMRYVESVAVALPPFSETPAGIKAQLTERAS